MTDTNPARYVSVVCNVCRARLDETIGEAARTVDCPDCFSPVHVPSAAEVAALAAPARSAPEVEPYRLSSPETLGNAQQLKQDKRPSVAVDCPICKAHLHCRPRAKPSHIACPDCGEAVRVPSRADVERERELKRRKLDPVEPLPIPEQPDEPPRELKTHYWEQRSAVRREEIPDPPKHTFITGVWLFPFQPEVVSRWVILSIGMTVMGGIFALMFGLWSQLSAFSGVALAFFAMPALWIGIWTGSYAASNWLVVVEDTAAGNHTIHNWHEQNWREWILHGTFLLFLLSVAAVAGHGIGTISRVSGAGYWPAFLTTVWLLFPIILLSALESASWWTPLTLLILRSLGTAALGWIKFHVCAGALVAAAVACCWGLLAVSPLFGLLLVGPLLSATWLIYGRLLGRLAWVVSLGVEESGSEK